MSDQDTQQDWVVFDRIKTAGGKFIGHARLNNPKALNALSLPMIELLLPQLNSWRQDDSIALVLIEGAGDKAFCAGGDVVAMYKAMKASQGETPALVEEFFTREYMLDHLIHTYDKPLIIWGNGITMGGGLGLMAGASHRIVTETARIAMPEISIGLYPDVGGSWFLNRMPKGCGLFLGLTGASINAADAQYVGLADYLISQGSKDGFIEHLQQCEWTDAITWNHEKVSEVCLQFAEESRSLTPDSNIKAHQPLIEKVTQGKSLDEVINEIVSLEPGDDKWLSKAIATLKAGSPITACILFRQLQQGQGKSLEECFRMELGLSCRCGEVGEFQEGVRALLIDKDNKPEWKYPSVDRVPDSLIEHFFTSPWSQDDHPLKDLKG
ncbi:enoyl-CoA hydratase/isomerase family protein [Lacimicrobium alkaliphilum]|uniref:3-hydroxyisobutyryl-CoA hydrolase n=1 Tax=Lacimicrobium alkaliphilum TaxID=1526571 RepID=A0ABQ1R1Y1_9ALTE|nr:enoyl-CoA hydratase/isomerase family protein [Lacimicrobium alkaliphilum]GGD53482.1 enoyl-CoA hydratase [Lacimicrobium alkaliphilum]